MSDRREGVSRFNPFQRRGTGGGGGGSSRFPGRGNNDPGEGPSRPTPSNVRPVSIPSTDSRSLGSLEGMMGHPSGAPASTPSVGMGRGGLAPQIASNARPPPPRPPPPRPPPPPYIQRLEAPLPPTPPDASAAPSYRTRPSVSPQGSGEGPSSDFPEQDPPAQDPGEGQLPYRPGPGSIGGSAPSAPDPRVADPGTQFSRLPPGATDTAPRRLGPTEEFYQGGTRPPAPPKDDGAGRGFGDGSGP